MIVQMVLLSYGRSPKRFYKVESLNQDYFSTFQWMTLYIPASLHIYRCLRINYYCFCLRILMWYFYLVQVSQELQLLSLNMRKFESWTNQIMIIILIIELGTGVIIVRYHYLIDVYAFFNDGVVQKEKEPFGRSIRLSGSH